MESDSADKTEAEQEEAMDYNGWGGFGKTASGKGVFKKSEAMGDKQDEVTKRKIKDKGVLKKSRAMGDKSDEAQKWNTTIEGVFKRSRAMGDEEDKVTKRIINDEAIRSLSQQSAAEFDLTFDPKHTPRIALLCQVCHTALQTSAYLSKDESHRQKLASGALRVRIWSMDLFDPTKCTPLDELLSLPSSGRVSLRNHLTGIWADIAATLELILQHLIAQTAAASPESCTQWRRLRIILGLEDVATAVHDGFSPPGSIDSDCDYEDSSEVLSDAIDSVEGLIDCLFDLLVTIGTIRQLHKLGFIPNTTSSSTFGTIENQLDQFDNKDEAYVSSRPPPLSVTAGRGASVSASQMLQEPQECASQVSAGYSTVKESTNLHEEATREDVPEERSDSWSGWSNVAVLDSSQDPATGSVGRKENPPNLFNTLDNSKASSNRAKRVPRTVRRDLPNYHSRYQVKLQDVYGRIFSFPFESCRTWEGTQELIKEAFESTTGPYAKAYKAHVKHGKYDIIDHSNNEVIIPSQWGSVIAPGMNLRMVIYSVGLLDLQVPHSPSYYDTENSYRQSKKRPNASRNAGAPSRVSQGYVNSNKESQSEDTHRPKDSNDEETTPTASALMYPREKPPSLTSRTTRHGLYLSLPETPSLPNFEELGIGFKPPQKPAARDPVRNGFEYANVSTGYGDSTYGSMGSVGASHPYSDPSYVNQPGVSFPAAKGPASHVPGPFQWPVLDPPSSGRPAKQPLDLDLDNRLAKLEQLLLDERAERKAREAAAQNVEQDVQALAKKGAEEAEGARSVLARAIVKADKTEMEMSQAAIEEDKAQVEKEGNVSTAAEPRPVELNDAFGRTFVLPYQMCSTWERMNSLVKQAFDHDKPPYPQIAKGHYDFLSPGGDVLLPGTWESSVEPGGKVTIRMWPFEGFGIQEPSLWEWPKPTTPSRVGYQATRQFLKPESKRLDDAGVSSPTALHVINPSSPPPPPPPPPVPTSKCRSWVVPDLTHNAKSEHRTGTSNPSSEDESPKISKPRSKWKDRILRSFGATHSLIQDDLVDD